MTAISDLIRAASGLYRDIAPRRGLGAHCGHGGEAPPTAAVCKCRRDTESAMEVVADEVPALCLDKGSAGIRACSRIQFLTDYETGTSPPPSAGRLLP